MSVSRTHFKIYVYKELVDSDPIVFVLPDDFRPIFFLSYPNHSVIFF